MQKQVLGWMFLTLIGSAAIVPALADPVSSQRFASKPYQKQQELNSIPSGGDSFSWTNLLGLAMQMFLPSSGTDKIDTSSAIQGTDGSFNWMPLVTAGVKLLLSFLAPTDSTDRIGANDAMQGILTYALSALLGVNNQEQASVMAKQAQELIGIAVTLMDTLKTSFSRRSLQARSLGESDPWSEIALAAVSTVKSYTRTYLSDDDICKQKVLCQGNRECVDEGGNSAYFYCQLGAYASSYILEKTTYTPFDIFNDASRRGRTGESCEQIFIQCNEV